ncbi:hypothetical protein [Streptomyces lydicus]|nr:hypothetical protein [Streptomyces lydicus]MCZ1012263.1 hypothetical protein [Streptomyces lydicus]
MADVLRCLLGNQVQVHGEGVQAGSSPSGQGLAECAVAMTRL